MRVLFLDIDGVLNRTAFRPATSLGPSSCEAWMLAHDVVPASIAIVDDGYDMGALVARFVRVSPLVGLDDEAAAALVALFESDRESA